jgi:hypothetical protein
VYGTRSDDVTSDSCAYRVPVIKSAALPVAAYFRAQRAPIIKRILFTGRGILVTPSKFDSRQR